MPVRSFRHKKVCLCCKGYGAFFNSRLGRIELSVLVRRIAEPRPTVAMEKFVVDGYPEVTLSLALFKNVKNATFLKSKHLARVSLLDAGLLLSIFQLRVAAAMSVEKERAGKMKTRSLPSELVWSLSGSKNLTSSLQTFCVQEVEDANLLVAAIGVDEEEFRSILGDVEGEPCKLSELGGGLDVGGKGGGKGGSGRDRFKKMYKITEEELAVSSLEDSVVMRMTVKDH